VHTGAGQHGERWVEINLTQQMLYAWEGDILAASFVVSTGTWQTPPSPAHTAFMPASNTKT
jgi:hypothetical protein